jgi:hypothetical protein
MLHSGCDDHGQRRFARHRFATYRRTPVYLDSTPAPGESRRVTDERALEHQEFFGRFKLKQRRHIHLQGDYERFF